MTLENISERLNLIGKPLADVQSEAIKRFAERIGSKKTFFHEPLKSKLFYVEASVEENNCYILHPNGSIDHIWDESEANSFGMMVWYDTEVCNIIIAYF